MHKLRTFHKGTAKQITSIYKLFGAASFRTCRAAVAGCNRFVSVFFYKEKSREKSMEKDYFLTGFFWLKRIDRLESYESLASGKNGISKHFCICILCLVLFGCWLV